MNLEFNFSQPKQRKQTSGMLYGMGDVIANANSEESEATVCYLPDYLQHQRYIRTHQSNAVCKSDFIVVTEFTEDVGPVPLNDYMIPAREDIVKHGLDLDDFATNIMSGDYFAQTSVQDQRFRMPNNIHALLSNTKKQCYTVLYAFTLYDIEGRGHVRPLYLIYTSHERDKIVGIYEWLTQAIAKAVHRLIHNNIRMFSNDLATAIFIHRQKQQSSPEKHDAKEDERAAYLELVQDEVNLKLKSLGDCCGFKEKQPASLDMSEFVVLDTRGDTALRLITDISDYWFEFKQDLRTIHKRFSRSYAQIMQSLREEYISYDTFNCLNIGGSASALLRIHDDQMRKTSRHENRHSRDEKTSVVSIDSSHSELSFQSVPSKASASISSSPTNHFYSQPASLTSTISSYNSEHGDSSLTSDPGVYSLTSDPGGASSLTSDPCGTSSVTSDPGASSMTSDPDAVTDNLCSSACAAGCADFSVSVEHTLTSSRLGESQSTMKAFLDEDSISTDSLLSRGVSIDPYSYLDPVLSSSVMKLIADGPCSTIPQLYPELKILISNHREYARDLIYSVMTSRPVVLAETVSSRSKEPAYQNICKALISFVPCHHRAYKGNGYHVVKEEITLKSICVQPITCLETSSKSVKISDNIKAYASIYNINTKHYEGLLYEKDPRTKRSKGLLELFNRKRKHENSYYPLLVRSLVMDMSCKAHLLHSLLQNKSRPEQGDLMRLLGLKSDCDLNIIKNLVHMVLKQQYMSSHGLKEEDISAMSLMLTIH